MSKLIWQWLIRAITNQPKPLVLRDFETLADLHAWFSLHTELRMDLGNLCDDYARQARALAETDGYFLSLCLVWQGEAYGVLIFDDHTVYHVANMAVVTDTEEVWYVDLGFNKLVKLCNFYKGGRY